MKKITITFILFLLLPRLGENYSKKYFQEKKKVAIQKRLISYKNYLLTKDIDKSRIIYFMPHEFYIPINYAFKQQDKELINVFRECLTKDVFLKVKKSNRSKIDKYVFYFFLSEYLRLDDEVTTARIELFKLLNFELDNIWLRETGKVWKRERLNSKGKKERIDNILNKRNNGNQSYYNAITDLELFPMAMGVSLNLSQQKYGVYNKNLKDVLDVFTKVLKKEVVFYEDSTWVLQPNVWKDHRDFKNYIPSNGEDVVWDTSHFSRMPAYLKLLKMCYDKEPEEENYISKLQKGLELQFINKVCYYSSKEGLYFFTNFMNGNDSSYRVGYYNKGKGYMPSQNFKHIFWGWWKLLESEEINMIYEDILRNHEKYADKKYSIKLRSNLYKEIISLN